MNLLAQIQEVAFRGFWIGYLAVLIFYIYVMWRVFEKAGYPGIASIIPIYNTYVMVKIAGYSGWMLLGLLIPIVNIIILIMIYSGISDNFSKSGGFTLGLVFLGFIFWPILAFDDSTYVGLRN